MIMILASSENAKRFEKIRRKGVALLSSILNYKTLTLGMKIDVEKEMKRAPRIENPAVITTVCRQSGKDNEITVSEIPSTLNMTAVNVVVTCHQPSPSHSILTLTPGRTRNIDQDMEALRLSRQDNPFLQILASRENLVESIDESESDDAILMSQEFGDIDQLTLAQVHEHLVRSPPPASWSGTPIFHFPLENDYGRDETSAQNQFKSLPKTPARYTNETQLLRSDSPIEIRDRHSHPFSLLNPTPIRSLSEVRRLHRSADDSVQLMPSE